MNKSNFLELARESVIIIWLNDILLISNDIFVSSTCSNLFIKYIGNSIIGISTYYIV